MLFSECVYYVYYVSKMEFKVTEQEEQWICIKFYVKREHSAVETIHKRMIQKAAAIGNRWLAPSSRQCARSCITSRAEFFGET